MVSGVLPGDDDGEEDPVPDRDVDALDPHRSYTVNQGKLHAKDDVKIK